MSKLDALQLLSGVDNPKLAPLTITGVMKCSGEIETNLRLKEELCGLHVEDKEST